MINDHPPVFNRIIQKARSMHARIVALDMSDIGDNYDMSRKLSWPFVLYKHAKEYIEFILILFLLCIATVAIVGVPVISDASGHDLFLTIIMLIGIPLVLSSPIIVQTIVSHRFKKQFHWAQRETLPYEFIYDENWRDVVHALRLKDQLLDERKLIAWQLFRTKYTSAFEQEWKLDLDLEDAQLWINQLEDPTMQQRIQVLKQINTEEMVDAFGNRNHKDLVTFFEPLLNFETYVKKIRNVDDFRREELLRTGTISKYSCQWPDTKTQADNLFNQGFEHPVSEQDAESNTLQGIIKQLDLSVSDDLLQWLTSKKDDLRAAMQGREEDLELLVVKDTTDTFDASIQRLGTNDPNESTVYLLVRFPNLARSVGSVDRFFEHWYSEIIWQIVIQSIQKENRLRQKQRKE